MSFAPPRRAGARWVPVGAPGLEQLDLAVEGADILARGVVVGERGGTPYGVDYTIVCDRTWTVRALDLGTTRGMALSLRSDGAGHWINHDGRRLPEFDGCLDVDLAGTPFTQTLPIRRLDWTRQGARPAALAVLHVPFETFVPVVDGQRYACLEPGRRFRYEAADRSVAAELTVDDDGLVLDYPGLFTRVPSGTPPES